MELRFKDVTFDYVGHTDQDTLRALDGVSGSIGGGELLAVIGPNGAGKSTLVRLLAGLEKPTSGTIIVNDSPIEELAHRQRAREIAVVPQALSNLPDVHVDDFVLDGRYAFLNTWRGPGPADRKAVQDALAACDCEGLGGRLITRLSGGQRQRVLIARALAQESPFLLVDEPTNNLDPGHQLKIFELLRELADGGRAVLVVTHDLNLASQFASSMMLLDDGRVACEGSAEMVLSPAALGPIYGDGLTFGSLDLGQRLPDVKRPFVLPWRSSISPAKR
jgi:iron complex transport system ATP-binding protein